MKNTSIKTLVVLAVFCCMVLGAASQLTLQPAQAYHGQTELNFFRGNNISLPLTDNGYFMGSGNCDGCHGFDDTGEANVNDEGEDISPITLWRSGMMANSAKDPFWKAKVSHEVAVNPSHQQALEEKCTSCHAPMGKFSHDHFNLGTYSMADLETDSLGRDGVSCLSCHKQSTLNLGNEHSGVLHFINAPVAYGPFEKPFEPPMQDLVGILPVYGEHINDAGICAGCHTLLTNSVDLDGNFTGETFVEQATYHEWLNSDYNDGEALATTCQGCHMPRIEESVVISSNYSELFPRSPYGKHELVGGNTFMLKLMKENATDLGISASDEDFDRTIAATEQMLKQKTLNMEVSFDAVENDTAIFRVTLENLAGHKFPSGYPARRAFIQFFCLDETNDTIFRSGTTSAAHTLPTENITYEPHYDIIDSEDQVQIYEMVMGDVNGDVTTVLERAYTTLKDNRLVPKGFSTTHSVYDTTRIAGNALTDSNFNFDGFEGSGGDDIGYRVALNGYSGQLKVVARVYYQSAPPKWMEEMFASSTPAIDAFQDMYNTSDGTPVLVAADSIVNLSVVTGVRSSSSNEVLIYPNPTEDGLIRIEPFSTTSRAETRIAIFSSNGQRVPFIHKEQHLQLPSEKGLYLILIETDTEQRVFRVLHR